MVVGLNRFYNKAYRSLLQTTQADYYQLALFCVSPKSADWENERIFCTIRSFSQSALFALKGYYYFPNSVKFVSI